MRLVVTGGGTGGHVYPALEVAAGAHERGAELLYLGSLRGQESKLCEERGILFKGFPSEPLYSLKSARGWKSVAKLLQARRMAKKYLAAARADVVFSTGGYSAGPILAAAKALGVPYVIHDGNSVPGRAHRMFGRQAKGFLTTFFATERHYKDRPVVRTGQPIRKQLRAAAAARSRERFSEVVLANALSEGDVVEASLHGLEGHGTLGQDGRVTGAAILVLGGSQGSAYLNLAVPQAVAGLEREVQVIHAAGPTNFAETSARVKGLNLENYRVEPYLQAEAIADAYCQADLIVCRSGSSLAEVAMFGLPSVLVPLPSSADNHQHYNAVEFQDMGAGSIAGQEQGPYPKMVDMMRHWIDSEAARGEAARRLHEWDVPDATERIVAQIEAAAK